MRKFSFLGDIVQSGSSGSVVIADYSNELTSVRDHFDNNQHLFNVRLRVRVIVLLMTNHQTHPHNCSFIDRDIIYDAGTIQQLSKFLCI